MKGLLRRILALAVATVMLVSMATNAYAATFTLPSDLKTIEAEAFEGSQAIDTVVLPDGITTIGSRAFADSSLESINLPRSLTSIATDAFENSPNVVANVKSGSYAMTYCVENNIPYVTDPVNMPNELIPISVSASASTVEMGDTVTLTFTADEDLAAGTTPHYNFDVFYLNAAGEVISTERWGRDGLGDLEMLVQCAGAAKLRISLLEGNRTTPGAHPAVEIAVTGSDSKPYLEYSVVGEVYPGGQLRATVVAMNADKLTAAETVTITDEMGSFTKTVTVSAKTPKVSVDITVPRTWNWYDENGDYQGSYGVIFKHGNDEYTHYAYGEPLCEPYVEGCVGDSFTINTRVLPSEMPYTYAIADTSVATIDENAKITLLARGTTTGTLTTKTGLVFPFTVEVFEESSEGGGSTPANDLVLYVSAPRSVVDIDAEEIPIFYIYSDVEGSLENHYDESIPICFSFYDADGQLMDTIESEQWLEGDSYQAVWPEWSWWANRIDGDYSYIEFSFGDTEYEVIEPSTARVRVRSREEQGKMDFLVNSYYGEYSIGQTVTVPLTCTTPDLLAEYAAQGEVKVTAVVPYHSGEEIIKDVVPAVFDADTLTASLSFTVGEDALPGQGYDIALYCGEQKVNTAWIRISSGVGRLVYSMSMVTGESRALPIVFPDDVDLSKVYFKVDEPSVLSVDANGVATALAAGETSVYMYYEGSYGSVGYDDLYVRVCEPTTENPPVMTVTPLVDTVAFGDKLPVKLQLSGDTSALADSEITFILEMTFLDANKNILGSGGWVSGSMAENYTGEGMTTSLEVWTMNADFNRVAYVVITAEYNEDVSFALHYDYSLIAVTDVPDGNSTIYSLTVENEKIGQGDWAYIRIRRLPQSIGCDVTMALCDAEGNELASGTYYDNYYSIGMSFDTSDFEAGQTYALYLYVDGEPVEGASVSFYVGEPSLSLYGCSSRMPAGGTCSLSYSFANNYDCPVTFSSSDESIASIEEGNVFHALGKGAVTITATCEHGQTAEMDVIVYDPDSTYVPTVYLDTDVTGTVGWMNSLQFKVGVSGDLTEIPYGTMDFDFAVQVLDADENVLYNSADDGSYAFSCHYLQVKEEYEYWSNQNIWCKAAEMDGRFIRLVLTTNTQSSYNYTIDESRSSVTFALEPIEECTTPIVRVDTPSTINAGDSIDVTFTCYNPSSLGSGKTVKLMQYWDENNPLAQGLLTQETPSVTLSYMPNEGFTSGYFQYSYPRGSGYSSGSFSVNVFSYNSLGYDQKMQKGNYQYFSPNFSGSSVSLTYTSSDEAVATATDYGNRVRVDAVGAGTTVITGTAPSGESRSFTVTVFDNSNTVTPELYLDQSQNAATLEWVQTFSLTVKSETDPWMFASPYLRYTIDYLDADGNVLGSSTHSSNPEHSFVTQTDAVSWTVDLSKLAGYYTQGARSVRFTLEANGYTVDADNASVTLNIADPQQSETPVIYYTLPEYVCAGEPFDVTFTCMNPQTLDEDVRCAFRGDGYDEETLLVLTQDQPSVTGTITVPEDFSYSYYYVSICANLNAEAPVYYSPYITVWSGSVHISSPVLAMEGSTAASASYTPIDGFSLTWESADPSIATVNESGYVTGVSVGVTQILAHYGPMTMSAPVRVYDPQDIQTPEIYLLNGSPAQEAGVYYRGTLCFGTATELEKLNSVMTVATVLEGIDAQGEVVKSFSPSYWSLCFVDSNEVCVDFNLYGNESAAALYAGATQLRVRLIEYGDAYTIDPQRSSVVIPISDPSTWNETVIYINRPEVLFPGQEATIDVKIISFHSSIEGEDFVCALSARLNGQYLLETTEQTIGASSPSASYTFQLPEELNASSVTISYLIRSQDGSSLLDGGDIAVNCAYFVTTQPNTSVAKGSTFDAYYNGNGLSSLSKSFESLNPEVATVDENGTVTGVSVGVTTITAHYGELEHSFMVRVYDAEATKDAKLSLSAPETLTEWPWTGKGDLLLTADQPVENLGALTEVGVNSFFYDADGNLVSNLYATYHVTMLTSNQTFLSITNSDMVSMAKSGVVRVKHILANCSGSGFSVDNSTESAYTVELPMQPLAESDDPMLYSDTEYLGNSMFSNEQFALDIHAANASYSSPVTVVAYTDVNGYRSDLGQVTFTPSEGADAVLNVAPPANVSSFVAYAARVNSDGTETVIGSFYIKVILAPVAVTTLAELQSAHPYANNFSYAWSYTVEGATSLTVTFDSQSKTESTSCDPLKVGSLEGYKSDNMEYTLGGIIDVQPIIEGDTVIIWLNTDYSITYYGFAVTKIEATMEDGSTVTITE